MVGAIIVCNFSGGIGIVDLYQCIGVDSGKFILTVIKSGSCRSLVVKEAR